MNPTARQRTLVQAFRLGHVTREVLWLKLGVDAAWLFAFYSIPWPTVPLLDRVAGTLRKVRLDRTGYAPDGRYFGVGFPVYCLQTEAGDQWFYRAEDRAHAVQVGRQAYPWVVFRS